MKSGRIWLRVAILSAVPLLFLLVTWLVVVRMPEASYRGDLPPLATEEAKLVDALKREVEGLARDIGERNVGTPASLERAARHLEGRLSEVGYEVGRQSYRVAGIECHNLEVELPGVTAADEIVVVGAHYDSVPGSPGADDNASGAAAVIVLARAFAGSKPRRSLRFVEFANEEPPHFQTREMGSVRYARRSGDRKEKIVAMLSIETIGHYSDEGGSQKYPFPLGMFYPSRGDFVAFVGNLRSRELVHRSIGVFRRNQRFPSEGAAAPELLPGVGWSDHWAFWQEGYPALMVTDTAAFRNPRYHEANDTAETLDYERMARVVNGLAVVVRELAGI